MRKSTILALIFGLFGLLGTWYAYAYGPDHWPQGILFVCLVWGIVVFCALANYIYEMHLDENCKNDAKWEDDDDS